MAKRKTPAQPETRPRPTMRKIAAQAGVSPTTVAHVLNQTPGAYVAADTRQRVLDAAAALGYQEALLSQSIKAPLRHLGMAVSDTEHPQLRADAMEIFEGARQEAFRHDYITVLLPMTPEVRPNYSSSRGVQAIEQFHRTKLIDGFILDKSSFLNHAVRKLAASGVPIATVNGAPIRSGRSRVPVLSAIVDNHAGARLAVEHLTQLGHQRIALLTRPWTSFPKQYRPYQVAQIIDGYRDALHAAGLEFDSGLVTDADPWDRQITYDAVDRVLSLDPPPSAIFAADDAIALMAIHALSRRGLRVPQQMSVVGYGDWSQAARLCEPALTSVHADLRRTGALAARMLIRQLQGEVDIDPQVLVPPALRVRASTGRI